MRLRCPACTVEAEPPRCGGCGREFAWADALLTVTDAADAAKALGNPTRFAILTYLREVGEASPKELAAHMDMKLGDADYHLKVLASLDPPAVVESRTRRVRGATQRFYRSAVESDRNGTPPP